jgi:hypothetical protein
LGLIFSKKLKKSCLKNPVFVSKTAQLGVQMKSRNESFGFFVFRSAYSAFNLYRY